MKTKLFFLSVTILMALACFSQIRKVPPAVKESFSLQYPSAEAVAWDDALFNVNVKFVLDNRQMNSKYSNKGVWKYTEERTSYNSVPSCIKEGFEKCKFAQLAVQEVDVVHYPDDTIRYRIKAGNNAVEKKYLYFDLDGKLVKQGITI